MTDKDTRLIDGVAIILQLETIVNENAIKLDPQFEQKLASFKQQTRDISSSSDVDKTLNRKTAPLLIPKPRISKSKSVGSVTSPDDMKEIYPSSPIDPFSTTLASIVININETLKPIDLPNVLRLFNEEKEFNENTILHIDPDVFCERAKQYHLQEVQAKRILSQLQSAPLEPSIPSYSILITKDPSETRPSRLNVRPPPIMKAKSLSALQALDNDRDEPLFTKEQWLKDKDKLDGIMSGTNKTRDKKQTLFVRTKSMNALQDREGATASERVKKDRKDSNTLKVHNDDEKEAAPKKNVLSENEILSVYKSYFNDIHDARSKADARINKLRSQLVEAATMKSLSECSEDVERQLLMKDKLELCEYICDFNRSKDEKESICIANKKDLFSEVLQCMTQHKWNNEELLKQCFTTVSRNLFRNLIEPDPFDEDPEDPSWDHICLTYELIYHVVSNSNTDKDLMRSYLEGAFCRNLVQLFRGPDDREPEYVKIIVHQIYGRFMKLRQPLRHIMSEYCYEYIYLSTYRNAHFSQGIAQILEIFGALFQGLNVPVKTGYHDILRNVIVPLHKTFHIDEFHAELVFCCTAFIVKEPQVICVILGGMLKFWPKQSQMKEQLFMLEMVEILNGCVENPEINLSDPTFVAITVAVLKQLVQCMASPHREVAEQAFISWNDATIKKLFVDLDREEILVNMCKILEENKENHWSQDIREIATEQLKLLDPPDNVSVLGFSDDEFNSDNDIRDM